MESDALNYNIGNELTPVPVVTNHVDLRKSKFR